MKIAIDASSVNNSGGLTYLYELLVNYEFKKTDNLEIEVWASKNTLDRLPNLKFYKKKDKSKFNKNIFTRFLWQTFLYNKMLRNSKTDVLYSLSAFYLGSFKPFILIHQNSLPFTNSELINYKYSLKYFKLLLQKKLTLYSFSRSTLVIFLNDYVRKIIIELLQKKITTKIIKHGLSKNFLRNPDKNNLLAKKYNNLDKIRLLYVSNFHTYKNHIALLKAFNILKKKYTLELTFVGKQFDQSLSNVKKFIKKNQLSNIYIFNEINYEDIKKIYNDTDFCIYPSTCENFPFGVIESLGLSIPIIVSKYICNLDSTFQKIISFDPNNIDEIVDSIEKYILNNHLRKKNTIELNYLVKKLDPVVNSKITFDTIILSYKNYINRINE